MSGEPYLSPCHLLAEMPQMADEVVVINRGQLVVDAGIPELLSHTQISVRPLPTNPSACASSCSHPGRRRISRPRRPRSEGASREEVGPRGRFGGDSAC